MLEYGDNIPEPKSRSVMSRLSQMRNDDANKNLIDFDNITEITVKGEHRYNYEGNMGRHHNKSSVNRMSDGAFSSNSNKQNDLKPQATHDRKIDN